MWVWNCLVYLLYCLLCGSEVACFKTNAWLHRISKSLEWFAASDKCRIGKPPPTWSKSLGRLLAALWHKMVGSTVQLDCVRHRVTRYVYAYLHWFRLRDVTSQFVASRTTNDTTRYYYCYYHCCYHWYYYYYYVLLLLLLLLSLSIIWSCQRSRRYVVTQRPEKSRGSRCGDAGIACDRSSHPVFP